MTELMTGYPVRREDVSDADDSPEVDQITFTLHPGEYAPLKQAADYEGRTLDEQVRRFMQEALGLREKTGVRDDAPPASRRPARARGTRS